MIYDTLLAAGLPVQDHRVPGYKNRSFTPLFTIVHHTAGTNSLNICKYGRHDLAAPLCHILVPKSGVLQVISDGYANHTGATYGGYSNYNSVGIEIENLGDGHDPYTPAQMQNTRLACIALGLPVLGHKEICSPVGRKIDPSFDMDAFRASLLQEEEVLAPDERNAVLNVNHWVINTLEDPNGQPIDLYGMLLGLSSQVAALQIGGGAVDIDALAEAVADKLAARLAN